MLKKEEISVDKVQCDITKYFCCKPELSGVATHTTSLSGRQLIS